ncbi:MAG: hypothetical protein DCC58_06290 [Chloroflexi bacterium]|nr:MAG: hypothetical protein DCC58_06290 [Chloroflexota bacterium]
MRWTHEVTIDGEAATVYDLASDLARWPNLLPHVRYTRQREDNDTWEIGYARFGFPLRCVCRCVAVPEQREVRLVHISGPGRGLAERFLVRNATRLHYTCATGRGSRPQQRVAARVFLRPLAVQTMEMIDLLATAERRATERGSTPKA